MEEWYTIYLSHLIDDFGYYKLLPFQLELNVFRYIRDERREDCHDQKYSVLRDHESPHQVFTAPVIPRSCEENLLRMNRVRRRRNVRKPLTDSSSKMPKIEIIISTLGWSRYLLGKITKISNVSRAS